LSSRAVWCYPAESYSTEHLINVIKKHECRNGSPAYYYSDLGSQIVGADRMMDEAIGKLNKVTLEGFAAGRNTEFRFGTAYHSAGQGAVERLIKEVKKHLKVLNKGSFTFGELDTLLSEVSYLVNSRPLQHHPTVGSDGFLSPNDVLFGRSSREPPFMEFQNCDLLRRVTEKEEILGEFWTKWSSSYLQSLNRYSNWKTPERNAHIGDIVLVLDKKVAPGRFLIAEIISIREQIDKLVRRVTVRYKLPSIHWNGEYKTFDRSVHGLALLLAAEERTDLQTRPIGQAHINVSSGLAGDPDPGPAVNPGHTPSDIANSDPVVVIPILHQPSVARPSEPAGQEPSVSSGPDQVYQSNPPQMHSKMKKFDIRLKRLNVSNLKPSRTTTRSGRIVKSVKRK